MTRIYFHDKKHFDIATISVSSAGDRICITNRFSREMEYEHHLEENPLGLRTENGFLVLGDLVFFREELRKQARFELAFSAVSFRLDGEESLLEVREARSTSRRGLNWFPMRHALQLDICDRCLRVVFPARGFEME